MNWLCFLWVIYSNCRMEEDLFFFNKIEPNAVVGSQLSLVFHISSFTQAEWSDALQTAFYDLPLLIPFCIEILYKRTPFGKITIAFITVQVYTVTPCRSVFHYSHFPAEKNWPFYQFCQIFPEKGLMRIGTLLEVVRKMNNY